MYTSHIGKQFLEAYNRTQRRKYMPKEFFEKCYFPLFFDNARYLQSPANTPLFQLIARKQTKSARARKEMLEQIHSKISAFESGDSLPEMSFAIGYPSADFMGTTSGQVSNMSLPLDDDDMYASWFGAALGIGMEGGLNMLIDNQQLLSMLHEGWELYRKHVDQNDGIDNKIETWNSVWLVHRLGEEFNPQNPSAGFRPVSIGKKKEASLERPSWTRVLFALSRLFPKTMLNAYVYSFGQMNKTIGFVQLNLPEVTRLSQMYKSLFGKMEILKNVSELERVYEAERGFNYACEVGVIGLRALQPKGLQKYMPGRGDKNEYPKQRKTLETQITYSIYISWILAMLNNKELLALAEKTAAALRDYVSRETRGKAARGNNVDRLLNSKSRKELIESLTVLVEDDAAISDTCNAIVNEVMLNIPQDNLPLFVTLLRFKYAIPTK